jgi:hypothetical protein
VEHSVTCKGVYVTYKTGFVSIDTLCTVLGITGNYSAIPILLNSQFTATHALGFSVFISRILATDLPQSHCYFKSHMKSSLHHLIPFLALIPRLPIRRLDSIQFLCSKAHILAGWRLEARPFTSLLCYSTRMRLLTVSFYNPSALTTQKTQLRFLRRRVYWSVV